ncbi:monocarboxylate permease-like protein [Colletotrichum tofieldiae]|uniref:Monocarboxylate permease-like protein n=1 Tax=Colletotrichum tofieldiae TaxID=708197 RepID=A0A166VNR6_9PEZI|nr:monocarboxylate permease-like protein [Colletotrichum tofieldiae]GKT82242.1 monocarboxylate permease-like protein [Colletotrichum tofieldiae]
MSIPQVDDDLVAHLKIRYASYRHTSDIDAKGAFFSPSCYQICRPNPSFAARNRDTIVRYLHEYAPKNNATVTEIAKKTTKRGLYTIRPLRDDEYEFGTDEQVAPVGFASAGEVQNKAIQEGWVGMRVDLWDDGLESQLDQEKSLLVKVQYWWRKENDIWLQIFHDILYMGPRDGTEANNGAILE